MKLEDYTLAATYLVAFLLLFLDLLVWRPI